MCVARECCLSGRSWLEELESSCRNRAIMWERDYWLPLPTDDLQATVATPARYEETVAFAKAVYMDLKVPHMGRVHGNLD